MEKGEAFLALFHFCHVQFAHASIACPFGCGFGDGDRTAGEYRAARAVQELLRRAASRESGVGDSPGAQRVQRPVDGLVEAGAGEAAATDGRLSEATGRVCERAAFP